MRVLVSGGLKTDAITRAMEKAFSDGSVLFESENFIKNIENFLSRGNYFDRAIIMEQSLTENGNNIDTDEIIGVVQRLAELITTKLLDQEVLFVLNTESIADLVSSEIFLASDRMKVLLYTSKEKYKVALFKALALTSFNELGTNINTKHLLYTPKEVETTEVYDENSMHNTGEEEVVVQINEDSPLDAPENLSGAIFNDDSLSEDIFNTPPSIGGGIGDIPDTFDNPQELGAILDEGNFEFGEVPADEPLVVPGMAGDIGDVGELAPKENEIFNKDDFGDDFGNGIDTTEQTSANGFEDMFTGVTPEAPVVEEPIQQEQITYDDNLGFNQNDLGLGGFSAESNKAFDNGMIAAIPENDKPEQFDFPELGDNFNNDSVPDTFNNDFSGTELSLPGNNPVPDMQGSSDMGVDNFNSGNDGMGLFGEYAEPESDNLGSFFDEPDSGGGNLEVDESLNNNSDESYMTDSAMLSGNMNNGMPGMNNMPNSMPGMQGMNNNMPGMQGNGLPPAKQKKGLFKGLGKKKNDMTPAVMGGVAAGAAVAMAGNTPQNNMPGMVQNNMPIVNQKPAKKGLLAKGNKANNNGGGMMVPQGPTQISIDPARVRDDELITMMNSYRVRGNCMVITGTSDSGSSTMAANLANVISKMGYTVLLVDMDNICRTQAYITKEVYSTIHSTDPSNNSLRLSINNKTGEVSRYATIVREGLNLITTGLAVDFEELSSIIRDERMLQNFIYGAKAAYNFVIFDAKFLDVTGYLKELVLNADSLVLNVKPTNKGLIEFMLKMANIDDIRVREDMFRRSGIVFNMATNNRNVLGYKVKNYMQMLEAIDKVTEELTGYTGEQSFGQISIFNEIAFNPVFDNYIFGKEFFSDTKEGNNLYKGILRSILMHR